MATWPAHFKSAVFSIMRNRSWILVVVHVLFLGGATSAPFAFGQEMKMPTGSTCTEHVYAGQRLMLCQAPPPALSSKDFFALGTSAFALSVSIFGIWYSRSKDKAARRHSIQDDFWLRKVLSPVTVEPLIRDLLSLIESLPRGNAPKESYKPFLESSQPKLQGLMTATHALNLIDEQLCKTCLGSLEKIEDELLEYCADHLAQRKDKRSREKVTETIRNGLNEILGAIKTFQTEKL